MHVSYAVSYESKRIQRHASVGGGAQVPRAQENNRDTQRHE